MKIESVAVMSPEEMKSIKNFEHYMLLMYRLAGLGFLTSAEISTIPQIENFVIYPKENTDRGTHSGFSIGPKKIVLNGNSVEPDPEQYQKLYSLINDAVEKFQKKNMGLENLRKHLILSSTTIEYKYSGTLLSFPPVKKTNQKYFSLLKESEDLDVFRTRFAISFLENGYSPDSSLDMVDIPKEWYDEIFSA